MFLALFGVVGTWAEDTPNATFKYDENNKNIENGSTVSGVTINLGNGADLYSNDCLVNLSSKESITLSSSYTITEVVFTFQGNSANRYGGDDASLKAGSSDLTNTSYSLNKESEQAVGTFNNIKASTVTFTAGSSSARIMKIEVYYLQGPVFTMDEPSTTTVAVSTSQIVLSANKELSDKANEISATFGKQGGTDSESITGTVGNDKKTITFDIPKSYQPLDKSTTYVLTLPANAVEAADGTANSEQTFSFTTVEGLAFTMNPTNGSTGVNVAIGQIVLTANKDNIKAVDGKEPSIEVTYTVNSEGTDKSLTVKGKTVVDGKTLVFTPERNLRASMTYTVSLDADVVTDGTESNVAFTGTFTTASNEHMITGQTSTGEEEVPGGYTVDMGSICMIYGGDIDRVDNAVWTLEPKEYANLDGRDIVKTLPSGKAQEKMRQCGDLDPVNEYCVYENRDVSYGDYIKTNKWGWSTRDGEFDHTNHLLIPDGMTHQKTFHQPCYGNLMFRPRVDGELTVYLLQQGALDHSGGKINPSRIRKRPVYIIDETGTLVQGVKATTTSNISAEYNNIKVGETEDDSNGTLEGDDMYSREQAKALKAMYDQWISDNKISVGDANGSQGVICLHHKSENISSNSDDDNIIGLMGEETYTDEKGTTWKYSKDFKKLLYQVNGCDRNATEESELKISVSENNTFNDNTGFMLIDEGYIKYKFRVLAGKTYNIFGYRTKIGYIGFDFDEDSDYDENIQTLTLSENANNNSGEIQKADRNKPYDVTIEREFIANQWQTLVLPFSVGQLQVKEVFGDKTEIIHFDNKTGNTINLMRHIMQMIVGGTPVIIKPSKDVENPVFTNVHFTGANGTASIDIMSNTDNGVTYKFNATYDKGATVPAYSYFVSGTDGNIYQSTADRTDVQAFRAWIEGANAEDIATAKFLDFGDVPENETTGIIEALADPTIKSATGDIYNINGQIVRRNASNVKGLPKGLYIMNGKKLIVK